MTTITVPTTVPTDLVPTTVPTDPDPTMDPTVPPDPPDPTLDLNTQELKAPKALIPWHLLEALTKRALPVKSLPLLPTLQPVPRLDDLLHKEYFHIEFA